VEFKMNVNSDATWINVAGSGLRYPKAAIPGPARMGRTLHRSSADLGPAARIQGPRNPAMTLDSAGTQTQEALQVQLQAQNPFDPQTAHAIHSD
jgi:hypothetical protein